METSAGQVDGGATATSADRHFYKSPTTFVPLIGMLAAVGLTVWQGALLIGGRGAALLVILPVIAIVPTALLGMTWVRVEGATVVVRNGLRVHRVAIADIRHIARPDWAAAWILGRYSFATLRIQGHRTVTMMGISVGEWLGSPVGTRLAAAIGKPLIER